jgi:hypothetical protein
MRSPTRRTMAVAAAFVEILAFDDFFVGFKAQSQFLIFGDDVERPAAGHRNCGAGDKKEEPPVTSARDFFSWRHYIKLRRERDHDRAHDRMDIGRPANERGWSVFLGVLIEQVIVPIPVSGHYYGGGVHIDSAGTATWGAAFFTSSLQIVLPGVVASALGAPRDLLRWGATGEKCSWTGSRNFWVFSGATWKALEPIFTAGGGNFACSPAGGPDRALVVNFCGGGVLEIPVGLFMVWSVLGTIVRCYLLAFLGWQMGGKALELAKAWTGLKASFLLMVGVVAGILYVRRVRKGLRTKKS